MKTIYQTLLIGIMLLLGGIKGYALSYRFDNMHIDGTSTICSFAQDESGMMWLGTENGLYSYDGYNFYPHFQRRDVTNSRVHSLCMRGEKLYLGTENGLMVYDVHAGRYIEKAKNGPHDIRAMLMMNDRILLGTSRGLYVKKGNSIRYAAEYGISQTVYSMLNTHWGQLIGTIDGLYVINGSHARRIMIGGGRQPLVNAIIADKYNNIWVGTEGALYSWNGRSFIPVLPLMGNSVKTLTLDAKDNLLAGTDNGLYMISKDAGVSRVIHDARSQESLANNIVWSLYRDRFNNIWIGTDNGMSMLSGLSFYSYTPLADITQSGDGNCLHYIYRDSRGTMWMGGTDGLLRYNDVNGVYAKVAWFRQNSPISPLSHNRVRRIYEDADGDIWVATDHGINWYDHKSGQFRNFIILDKTGRYSTAWAYDMVLDSRHRLWVAAYMGGVFVIDKRRLLYSHGTIIADHHIADGRGKLSNIHVGQLNVDAKGNIWALVYGSGLACINPVTFKVRTVMPQRSVSYMMSDSRGCIWAGYDGGVTMINPYSGKAIEHDFTDGFTSDRVVSMVDAGGQIWALGAQTCRIINMNGADRHFRIPGIVALTASYSPRDRMVYIGGNDGFVRVAPSVFSGKVKTHKLMLTSLLVNGHEYVNDECDIRFASQVELKYNENNISFRLSDMPYDNSPQAIYVYKLEGSDNDWRYLDSRNGEIQYNALGYGNYRLLVRNIDNTDEDAFVYSLDVRISPPWYLSLWAKLFYLVLVLALLRWIMNFYAVKKNLKLERIARQRIMEQAQARTRFFAHLSSELKVPLARILSPVYNLLASDNAKNTELEDIRDGASAINRLIYTSLDVDGDDSETMKSQIFTIDAVSYLKCVAADIRKRCDGNMRLDSDVTMLYIDVDVVRWDIVFNALFEFVQRHSDNDSESVITLRSDVEKQLLAISVANRTMRINEAERQFVFQKYNPVSSDADNVSSGLFMVKKYIESGKGSVTLDRNSVGTLVFKTQFPLDRKAAHSINSGEQENADKLFAQAVAIIEAHISDSEFNVTSLQTELGVGNKLLYRRVKQITGMTPVEYIRDIRMKKAALLLREGKYSVSEVMFMVGFSNTGYFSKCFQKAFGMTPTVFGKGRT
jgi:ligand-binding sensor domain-containing protein/AraC-like DNA-binding protein/signal transduction histidine kinase